MTDLVEEYAGPPTIPMAHECPEPYDDRHEWDYTPDDENYPPVPKFISCSRCGSKISVAKWRQDDG